MRESKSLVLPITLPGRLASFPATRRQLIRFRAQRQGQGWIGIWDWGLGIWRSEEPPASPASTAYSPSSFRFLLSDLRIRNALPRRRTAKQLHTQSRLAPHTQVMRLQAIQQWRAALFVTSPACGRDDIAACQSNAHPPSFRLPISHFRIRSAPAIFTALELSWFTVNRNSAVSRYHNCECQHHEQEPIVLFAIQF